ncbi:hypothetical protein GCM10009113_09160 [Marinobacter szutsaonensis]
MKVLYCPCHHTGINYQSLYYVDFSDDYTSQVWGGGGIPHPGMLKAKDGLKQAHMDVLVAVPGWGMPPPPCTNSKRLGEERWQKATGWSGSTWK